MFSCMQKKRNPSANADGGKPPIQQQPRGIANTNSKPNRNRNTRQFGQAPSIMEEDPLTQACLASFTEPQQARPRKAIGGSKTARERGPSPQLVMTTENNDTEPDQTNARQTRNGPSETRILTRESMADSEADYHLYQSMGADHHNEAYQKFILQQVTENRFNESELKELNQVFKKASTRSNFNVAEMIKAAGIMDKVQFRSQMGLLGQQQHPYLADRIFEVFDKDGDGEINLSEFTAIMDVLCNGTEDEKHMFSFALMDKNGNGQISFDEFYDYFFQVISHWSSLINSHVRINRASMFEIFEQISNKNKAYISYDQYRKALIKNPELLDWFDILNSQHSGAAQKGTGLTKAQTLKKQKEDAEEESKCIKIDKEKVHNLVRLKNTNDAKTETVKLLQSEMLNMQGQTSEQLQNIVEQISILKAQVQDQMTQKEEEQKKWEETILQQQDDISQYDVQLSQMQGQILTESNLGELVNANREQQLFAKLINDQDADQEMPFMASADADKYRRDDAFVRTQSRQPAMTFGIKQSRTQQQQDPQPQQEQNPNLDQREGRDFDSNGTMQQWQQKSLLQKTNLGSNSPTGQSSNFHFSQFNYEFTNGNNTKKPVSGPENFYFDDRHLKTHDNIYEERELETPAAASYRKTIEKRVKDNNYQLKNVTPSPYQAPVEKTYEEVMGPDASLNDILNYDFAGRLNQRQPQTSDKKDWRLDDSGKLKPSSFVESPANSISPIFEVLIKLRQGREQAKEEVGEKRINMNQVPSKQRSAQKTVHSPNRVNQKVIDDDFDDIIPDPESPINSSSPRNQTAFSVSNQQLAQNLKVNQRHQRRQEVMRSQGIPKSLDTQSVASSNLYRLSQMQGGGLDAIHETNMNQQEQAMTHQRSPATGYSYPQFQHPVQGHAQTEHKADFLSLRPEHYQPGTFPPSPVRKMAGPAIDTSQINHLEMQVSGENEDIAQQHQRHRQIDLSAISGSASQAAWGPKQFDHPFSGNKSAFNDDRGLRMDTASQFSQLQQFQGPRSVKTIIMHPKPQSPKAEKQLLNKLDEVNSQVNDWINKLEQQKKTSSINNSKLNADVSNKEDIKVVEELKLLASNRPRMKKREVKTHMIDTTDKKRPVSSFQDKRPKSSLAEPRQSNQSDSDDWRESHGTGTFSNAHQALSKVKTKNKSKKDKTFVHFGNEEWNLVLHMLFGIRQSVHSVRYDDVYQLTDAEFKSKLRYELEAVEDQKIWNVKKYEFYDFSPRMFNLIRKFYGINSNDYLKSIGPETLFGSLNMGRINSLKSQCSAGKSGSLFYYTTDGLYMLKTISHDEFEHFKAIMKNYYHHMLAYPHTMLTRFYGLHKIKFTRTTRIERVYFVIMANVFNTKQSIDVRYDLKGSLYGRNSRKKPDQVLAPTVALKDLDWLQDKRLMNLRDEQRNLIHQQLKADSLFFQQNNINDYSLLLGISKLRGGPTKAKEINRASIKHDMLFIEGIQSTIDQDQKRQAAKRTQSTFVSAGGLEGINLDMPSQKLSSMRMQSMAPHSLTRNDSELLIHQRARPEKAFFESQDGGMISADGTQIYFMGIIDILTNFGKKKRVENIVRSIVHDSQTISCIPPQAYGERYYNFMTSKVFLSQDQIRKEIKAKQEGTKSPVFD